MNELALLTGNLSATTNLASYKNYVSNIPNLTAEEEWELLSKFKINNCLESTKKLILSQLKTVVHVAYQFRNYGMAEEDLIQEGNIGLMKAVKNFKLEHKVRLYSYALIWIKAEMQSYILKNWKLVKIGTTKDLKKLFFNFKSLQKNLIEQGVPRNQLSNLIAEKLNVNIDDVNDIDNYFNNADVVIEMEDSDSPILQIGHDNTPEKIYMETHDKEKASTALVKALDLLNEKQKQVINMRYLTEEKQTHKEIASFIGVSSERVRQIEVEAITKMRKVLNENFSIKSLYN